MVLNHSCSGFKTCLHILEHSFYREVVSMSPSFEPSWDFVTTLMKRKLQKGSWVISKAIKIAMWLLLVSFGTITWRPFSHHERSPGTSEVTMWWEYMGTGERCFSSTAIGVFPDARYGNKYSYILPPSDSNHMSYLTETHWVESSQFPRCEQINDWYYFKSLFGADLLNNKKK